MSDVDFKNAPNAPGSERKVGLVLEGGGFRCMFTAAILDVMMEHELQPDGIVGVSAGSAFGVNMKSQQPERALRYNKRFAHTWRYTSWLSWLLTGNLVNAKYAYHVVPTRYDIFDAETFKSNTLEFFCVCTDVDTGHPVYHQLTEVSHETLEWIRASASLPVVSKIVRIGKQKLLDGGISDSIPLKFFQNRGYERNIVILTQPRSYRKKQMKIIGLVDFWLRHHPNARLAIDSRPEMYNAQLDYIAEQEQLGQTLVLAPEEPLAIADVTKDPNEMQRVYDLGRAYAEKQLDEIRTFLQKS